MLTLPTSIWPPGESITTMAKFHLISLFHQFLACVDHVCLFLWTPGQDAVYLLWRLKHLPSCSTLLVSHTQAQYLSYHFSSHLLSLNQHILSSVSGQQHLHFCKIQDRGNQRNLRDVACMFVDMLYVINKYSVPQNYYYYLVSLQRPPIRLDDLFRKCTVQGIIIFYEIYKSINVASCRQAKIAVFWMHALCPLNMICGLYFKVLCVFFSDFIVFLMPEVLNIWTQSSLLPIHDTKKKKYLVSFDKNISY